MLFYRASPLVKTAHPGSSFIYFLPTACPSVRHRLRPPLRHVPPSIAIAELQRSSASCSRHRSTTPSWGIERAARREPQSRVSTARAFHVWCRHLRPSSAILGPAASSSDLHCLPSLPSSCSGKVSVLTAHFLKFAMLSCKFIRLVG